MTDVGQDRKDRRRAVNFGRGNPAPPAPQPGAAPVPPPAAAPQPLPAAPPPIGVVANSRGRFPAFPSPPGPIARWDARTISQLARGPYQVFQRAVAKMGEPINTKIVAEFRQSEWLASNLTNVFPEAYKAQITAETPRLEGGVCHALSQVWMACRANGRDFFSYVKRPANADNIFLLQKSSLNAVDDMRDKIVEMKQRLAVHQGGFMKWRDKLAQEQPPNYQHKLQQEQDYIQHLRHILPKAEAGYEDSIKTQRNFILQTISAQIGDKDKLRKHGDTMRCATVEEACNQLKGREGYVYVNVQGTTSAHAIAVYFSGDQIRLMDPNYGEVALFDSASVPGDCTIDGAAGLRAHLDTFFPNFLGQLNYIELDYYPLKERPGGMEPPVPIPAAAQTVAGVNDPPQQPPRSPTSVAAAAGGGGGEKGSDGSGGGSNADVI